MKIRYYLGSKLNNLRDRDMPDAPLQGERADIESVLAPIFEDIYRSSSLTTPPPGYDTVSVQNVSAGKVTLDLLNSSVPAGSPYNIPSIERNVFSFHVDLLERVAAVNMDPALVKKVLEKVQSALVDSYRRPAKTTSPVGDLPTIITEYSRLERACAGRGLPLVPALSVFADYVVSLLEAGRRNGTPDIPADQLNVFHDIVDSYLGTPSDREQVLPIRSRLEKALKGYSLFHETAPDSRPLGQVISDEQDLKI